MLMIGCFKLKVVRGNLSKVSKVGNVISRETFFGETDDVIIKSHTV